MESEERSEEAQEREHQDSERQEEIREHNERVANPEAPQHDVGPTGQPAEGAEAEPESQD